MEHNIYVFVLQNWTYDQHRNIKIRRKGYLSHPCPTHPKYRSLLQMANL